MVNNKDLLDFIYKNIESIEINGTIWLNPSITSEHIGDNIVDNNSAEEVTNERIR